jgi:hypothetical protein
VPDHWTLPIGLSPSGPRKVRTALALKLKVAAAALIFLVPTVLSPVPESVVAPERQILRERGVDATAQVMKAYTTSLSGGMIYHLQYRFSRDGSPRSYVSIDDEVPSNIFVQCPVGRPIPIIYDPLDAGRAAINFYDVVRHPASRSWLRAVLYRVLTISPFILGMAALLLWRHPDNRRLLQWGTAVPARVVSEEEIRTRYGSYSKVTYVFKDGFGLPLSRDTRRGFTEYRKLVLDNPTVLFQWNDSTINTLYPPDSVWLR